MDDIRKSFSKLKKGFKHRVGGKKHAPGEAGAGTAGERVSSSASPLGPGPRVTGSGQYEEEARISTDVSQVHSRDPSPHPEPMPVDEGCLDDSQRKEVGVDEKDLDDVEIAAGGIPSQNVKQTSSTLSVASIQRKQDPDSTRTLSPQRLFLIIPSQNSGNPAVLDHTQKGLHLDENAEPNATANEKKSNWKSTALATAKLLLRGVRDSADAFGPLKSVAGGLCFILENCEVWSSPTSTIATLTGTPANEGERANNGIVGTPGEGTCRIAQFTRFQRRCQGATEEKDPGAVSFLLAFYGRVSQMRVHRKLEDVHEELVRLGEQGKTKGFFTNVENAEKLVGLVEDVHGAMMDYQVRVLNDLPFLSSTFL